MRKYVEEWGRHAIKLIQQQTSFSIHTKSSEDDLVTSVDRNLELKLRSWIHNRYPTHQIIGEEHGLSDQVSDHLWILDPIDGTTNFVKQGKNYGMLIAYYYQHQPILGAIIDVLNEDIYIAEVNQAVFKNGVPMEGPKPLRLSESLVSIDPGFASSFKSFEALKKQCFKMRYIGACSLDSLGVINGEFGVFVSHQGHVWDYAVPFVFAKVLNLGVCRLDGSVFDPFTASDMVLYNPGMEAEIREVLYA